MYQTKYQDALTANNLTRNDLYKKDQKLLDDVIELEKQLKEVNESLGDADKDDIPGINDSITNISTVLANQDKFVCEKINATPALKIANKAKMQNAQNGRKHNKKDGNTDTTGSAAAQQSAAATGAVNNEQQQNNTQPAAQAPAAAAAPAAQQTSAAAAQPNTGSQAPVEKKKEEVIAKKEKTRKINFGAVFVGLLLTACGVGYGLHASKTGKWPFKAKN